MGWLCGRIAIRFYLTAVGIGHDLLLVLNPLHALGAPKVLKLRFLLATQYLLSTDCSGSIKMNLLPCGFMERLI